MEKVRVPEFNVPPEMAQHRKPRRGEPGSIIRRSTLVRREREDDGLPVDVPSCCVAQFCTATQSNYSTNDYQYGRLNCRRPDEVNYVV